MSERIQAKQKVSVIVLGAQKCATTSLYYLLRTHPQMCGATVKETNFFSNSTDWRRDISLYDQQFNPLPGQLCVEASPSYTQHPLFPNKQVWEDMHAYNPDLKLIYLVRKPVDRIISAYMHRYQVGDISLSLREAVRKDETLVLTTQYYTQIRPFVALFGVDQILFIDFDDFTKDQPAVMQRVAEYIGVPFDSFQMPDVHRNRSLANDKIPHSWRYPSGTRKVFKSIAPKVYRRVALRTKRRFNETPVLDPHEQQRILQILEGEIDQMEGLLGKSLQHWKEVTLPAHMQRV